MKKIIVLALSLCTFIAADEFVEAGTSFGGYGELHYDIEGEGLDFHRFVLFFNNTWDDTWSFKSEVELEHNMVGSCCGGELELEQAYVNYYNGSWGSQAGVILMPVGIINEYHEPPTFVSVERPEYNKRVIPTTWFGNGFNFYGSMDNLDWKVTMFEDLNGDEISDGIRSARGKGEKTSAIDWTKSFQLVWTGMEGLRLGGSYTMNDAPTSAVEASTTHAPVWNETTSTWDVETTIVEEQVAGEIGVKLMELNGTYSRDNLYARFEYGKIDYTDNPSAESTSGYYLDLGYDISSMVGCEGSLMPWMRASAYNKDDMGADHEISLFGLTYKPHSGISYKIEMGESGDKDIMRMGVGYMF